MLLAGFASLPLVVLTPGGTDLSASTSHALFAARHGLTPLDLSWYGGTSQFGYSLWAQFVMAAFGTRPVGLAAGLVAAAAFAVLLVRAQPLVRRPLLGSLAGAVCIVLNLVSGRMTYALGLAVGLLALLALPRRGPTAALSLLAAAASPVAGLFLGLAGTALLLTGRPRDGVALAAPSAAALVVTGLLFGQGGANTMSATDLWTGLVLTAGAALAVRSRAVRVGALLLGAGLVVAYALPTPVGLNALRLPVMFAVPVLLAAAPWRPLLVGLAAAGLLCVHLPVQTSDVRRLGSEANTEGFFQPLATEIARRAPSGRVEVVPTVDYWEAARIPPVAPLARGWLRQLDTLRDPLFFDGTLSPGTYRDWLQDNGVQYVAVPSRHTAYVGRAEGALVRGGLPYLQPVWSGGAWTLYAVAGPAPLAQGAAVVASDAASVVLRVDRPGDVLVRVHPDRWVTLHGPGCLAPAGHWLVLHAARAGRFTVTSSLRPAGRC